MLLIYNELQVLFAIKNQIIFLNYFINKIYFITLAKEEV